MSSVTTGLFLPYLTDPANPADPIARLSPALKISVGGGRFHAATMDTGSFSILLPLSILRDYEVIEPNATFRYGSSGNTYTGSRVIAPVTVKGEGDASITTSENIEVFGIVTLNGAKLTPQQERDIGMLGVGVQNPVASSEPGSGNPGDPAAEVLVPRNPFLHLSNQFPRTGYILTRSGVQFGYDDSDVAGFQPLLVNAPAQATVSLTPPASSGLQPYSATVPLLLDTGIDYMIVTPPGGEQAPAGYETTVPVMDPATGKPEIDPRTGNPKTFMQWIPGVDVTVELGGQTLWSYNTSDFGHPGLPRSGRFGAGTAGGPGIVNTGRHLLEHFDYLVDVTHGHVVGLRPAANTPPQG